VGNPDEAETRIVASSVMRAATGETGGLTAHRLHARDLNPATGALIAMTFVQLAAWQRQIVAARFIRESEFDTGLAPLRAVGCDAAATGAMVREQMSEFVAQRAFNFIITKFAQPWIQVHQRLGRKGSARRAAHACVPTNGNAGREFRASDFA